MPDKLLDDAGEMLPCCSAVHLRSQRPATAILVSKRMACPSSSLNVEPKAAAVAASQHLQTGLVWQNDKACCRG